MCKRKSIEHKPLHVSSRFILTSTLRKLQRFLLHKLRNKDQKRLSELTPGSSTLEPVSNTWNWQQFPPNSLGHWQGGRRGEGRGSCHKPTGALRSPVLAATTVISSKTETVFVLPRKGESYPCNSDTLSPPHTWRAAKLEPITFHGPC